MSSAKENGSQRYFGDKPYPFDMDLVEQRDGAPMSVMIRRIFNLHDTIIDGGCGYGRYSEVLAESVGTVIALDHSFACVSRTLKRVNSVIGICADISALPLRPATVDGVISLYSSVGLDGVGLEQQISEFTRITRIGGRLLLDVASPGSVGFPFGIERLPNGLGIFFRFGLRGRRSQFNMALSLSNVRFYRLLYSTYSAEEIRAVLEHEWRIELIAGDYEGSMYSKDSPRIIVCAVRL